MKLNPPKLHYTTIELAERWETTESEITLLLVNQKLEIDIDRFPEIFFKSEEVSRFEREHPEYFIKEAVPPTNTPTAWPWGNYENELLPILAEAVKEFCADGKDAHYPKKDTNEVQNWIIERMKAKGMTPTQNIANTIETMISPRKFAPHRQKKAPKKE